jgi:hypothetical protein
VQYLDLDAHTSENEISAHKSESDQEQTETDKTQILQDDIKTRVRENLTAMVWKGKEDVNMSTNVHHLPA